MPSEIKNLITSFVDAMPISTHFTSSTHSISSIKKFIQSVPQLMSVVPNMDTELDGFIQRIMTALLEIRAAFTFDPISFISFDDTKFFSVVTMLRTGLRNTVFTDNEIALLSGIYILQTANGVESNVFPVYCQGLRDEFNKTHPYEVGICDRTLTKLGSQIL
uniref:NR LBD domain-containing protein n=1 Tax=Caenorhabditis tropicalis TaxID=1561998 RepID=A0A1I7UL57_9PELO